YAFGRMALNDVEIDGYTIPQGSSVGVISYLAHRDPRWWDAPERFNPDRFSPENEPNIRRYSYLPFGAGPRICIGSSFAMMEAHLLLVAIAQRYRLRLNPGQVVEPEPLITLRPKHGLHMRLEVREPRLEAVPA
ncbi:MAG: cytochrome P450, partial [Anaerolineae bacterium]|nr:cytochrome P450 [Anaerolineae bacterium]